MPQTMTNERLKELLRPGRLFAEKYQIRRPLGAGSFAIVMHAVHEVMDRDVAIKILKPKVVRKSPDVADRFIQEVRIAAGLNHPHIVQIYDFGTTSEGIYYMVMEYLDGVTVTDLLAEEGRFIEPRAIEVTMQVLDALEVAHERGIVHRDLKPQNVMLRRGDAAHEAHCKILDFGVAKVVDERSDRPDVKSPKSRSTKFIGTPIYMSPEQILGQGVAPVSDLYAVGLVLYEMLTGLPPLQAKKVAEVVHQHLDARQLPFQGLQMLSEPMRAVVLKATKRYPEDRFQSAREFRRALESVLEGHPPVEIELDSPAPPPAADAAETDSSADARRNEDKPLPDVFSGKNYIGHDLEDDFEPLLESTRPRRVSSSRGRRSTSPGKRESHAPAPNSPVREKPPTTGVLRDITGEYQLRGDELELDIGRVKRVDAQRRRPTKKSKSAQRPGVPASNSGDKLGAVGLLKAAALICLGICGFYLSFWLLGLAFLTNGRGTGIVMGLLPFAAAGAWTMFASVPSNVDRRLLQRWIIPYFRNGALIFLGLFVTLALTMSKPMASRCINSSDWFLGEANNSVGKALLGLNEGLAEIFSAVFAQIANMLPW